MGVIYCIHCLKTNKKYIGKTERKYLSTRINHHFHYGRENKYCNPLYEDMNTFGRKSFIYGVVEGDIPSDLLDEKERYYVSLYWNTGLLYNQRIPSGCSNRTEYNKQHYQENKEHKSEYYQQNKERISKRNKENYEYTEELKRKKREYYLKNKERILEKKREKKKQRQSKNE